MRGEYSLGVRTGARWSTIELLYTCAKLSAAEAGENTCSRRAAATARSILAINFVVRRDIRHRADSGNDSRADACMYCVPAVSMRLQQCPDCAGVTLLDLFSF